MSRQSRKAGENNWNRQERTLACNWPSTSIILISSVILEPWEKTEGLEEREILGVEWRMNCIE